MGTDEITLLDIQIAPFWEMLYLMTKGPLENVGKELNLAKNAPHLL